MGISDVWSYLFMGLPVFENSGFGNFGLEPLVFDAFGFEDFGFRYFRLCDFWFS